MIKKSSFLLIIFLLVGVLISGNVIAQSYQIRLGHIDPATHPHHLASEKFAEIVEEKTDGDIVVEVYPAGQLGNAPDLMEQLTIGSIPMFQGGVGWWGSYLPDYWLVASNFVYDSLEHTMSIMKGEIGERLGQQLSEDHNVTVLTQGMIRNPRHLLTKEPVESLEDLEGLRIRVPEMENWMRPWEALGASPTPMPLPDTFLGLQQGTVDGVEHGFPQLYLNNYSEVAKYLTTTEHQYETAGFFISNVFFDQLPEEYQTIIKEAAIEAEKYNNQLQVDYRRDMRENLVENHNVEIIEIDNASWYEVGRQIMQEEVVAELGITEGLLEEIWNTPVNKEIIEGIEYFEVY